MLKRTISLSVDAKTFPKGLVPAFLAGSGAATLDMGQALLMLGTLSIPGGFTSASPARYWSWVRYFSAISPHSDLRIVQQFVDLDPHQKTILSDDFGVAVTTQLIFDKLGGFKDVVDGRQFISLYASLIRSGGLKKKFPKVGPGKCPDFVILDKSGKWHVLECKGTQTSGVVRNGQLKTAFDQKNAIQVKGAVRGERLAAGLYLADEYSTISSSIKIVDPEPEPYVTVDYRRQHDAEKVQRRLAISRALGLSGFIPLAEELSMPTEIHEDTIQFLSTEERRRAKIPAADRLNAAVVMLARTKTSPFAVRKKEFTGRSVTIELPSSPFSDRGGFSRVKVSVGIDVNLLEKIRGISKVGMGVIEEVDDRIGDLISQGEVVVDSNESEISIRAGNFYAADLQFI
ncbi:hypothetical protein ACTJK6_20550 [Ralstonia sp. 22086]|uniref:hypothetical protein n=1 Tax=Ralstonia sp. 22086 TaxID=3453870 RepID=UPI003F83691D